MGDIHGRSDLLDILIEQIEADCRERGEIDTRIVFLGDLIDRGPDSAGVVDRLISYSRSRPNARFLTGNHEEVFLLALQGDVDALRLFVRIGGKQTILSYGVSLEDYNRGGYEELCDLLIQRVPKDHVDFIKSFEDVIIFGDYAFVHAGIRPGRCFSDQRVEDVRWIRREFLDHDEDFGKIVVHGHSISSEVDERPNRIGIDTGAYFSDRLTALGLEGEQRWYLST